jgi:hypothetical protein
MLGEILQADSRALHPDSGHRADDEDSDTDRDFEEMQAANHDRGLQNSRKRTKPPTDEAATTRARYRIRHDVHHRGNLMPVTATEVAAVEPEQLQCLIIEISDKTRNVNRFRAITKDLVIEPGQGRLTLPSNKTTSPSPPTLCQTPWTTLTEGPHRPPPAIALRHVLSLGPDPDRDWQLVGHPTKIPANETSQLLPAWQVWIQNNKADPPRRVRPFWYPARDRPSRGYHVQKAPIPKTVT